MTIGAPVHASKLQTVAATVTGSPAPGTVNCQFFVVVSAEFGVAPGADQRIDVHWPLKDAAQPTCHWLPSETALQTTLASIAGAGGVGVDVGPPGNVAVGVGVGVGLTAGNSTATAAVDAATREPQAAISATQSRGQR